MLAADCGLAGISSASSAFCRILGVIAGFGIPKIPMGGRSLPVRGLGPVSAAACRAGLAVAFASVSLEHDDVTLAGYRSSIDNIDAALILLLAERFKVTKQVGVHKASVGLPPADPDREERQIERLRELSASANLDPAFSEKFLRLVIDEVIRHHDLVRNDATVAGG